MNTTLTRKLNSIKGSALLAAVIVSTVLTVTVGGFLAYINHEYYINFRSFHWTQALHLAEAGIEDGFFEMNERYPQGSAFLSANGWQSIGGGIAALQTLGAGDTGYSKTVTNLTDSNGNVVGSYTVQVINPTGTNPYILAKGTVANAPYGIQVSRLTKIVLQGSSVFNFALFSKVSITGSGNMATDSYISNDPAYSTNGLYDSSKRRGNGDVGSNGTASNTIGLSGNADINGVVGVGPGGSLTTSGNASVGPIGYGTGVAAGYFRNDMAVDIPNASLPTDYSTSTWANYGAINYSGNTVGTISAGDRRISSISLSGNAVLNLTGDHRMHVTGNISISGNAVLRIVSGGSIKMYVAGSSVSISGNGVTNNSLTPDKFQLYGMSTCTSVSFSGNAALITAIYAPQAALSISGNGDLSGAAVANTISMSGNGDFHYDEALKTTVGGSGYTVKCWQEINIPQQ